MISTAHVIENKKSERIRQYDVYCTLCQVLICVGSLNAHLNGKKHNKTLKGQLISECLLGAIDFPKTNKKIDKFLP